MTADSKTTIEVKVHADGRLPNDTRDNGARIASKIHAHLSTDGYYLAEQEFRLDPGGSEANGHRGTTYQFWKRE